MEFYKIENRFGILGNEKALKAIAGDFGAVGMQCNFVVPKEYLTLNLYLGSIRVISSSSSSSDSSKSFFSNPTKHYER